jgi:hypothetical protein
MLTLAKALHTPRGTQLRVKCAKSSVLCEQGTLNSRRLTRQQQEPFGGNQRLARREALLRLTKLVSIFTDFERLIVNDEPVHR